MNLFGIEYLNARRRDITPRAQPSRGGGEGGPRGYTSVLYAAFLMGNAPVMFNISSEEENASVYVHLLSEILALMKPARGKRDRAPSLCP